MYGFFGTKQPNGGVFSSQRYVNLPSIARILVFPFIFKMPTSQSEPTLPFPQPCQCQGVLWYDVLLRKVRFAPGAAAREEVRHQGLSTAQGNVDGVRCCRRGAGGAGSCCRTGIDTETCSSCCIVSPCWNVLPFQRCMLSHTSALSHTNSTHTHERTHKHNIHTSIANFTHHGIHQWIMSTFVIIHNWALCRGRLSNDKGAGAILSSSHPIRHRFHPQLLAHHLEAVCIKIFFVHCELHRGCSLKVREPVENLGRILQGNGETTEQRAQRRGVHDGSNAHRAAAV